MVQTTAYIVVNLHCHAGRCSHCGEDASVNDTVHTCGARFVGVAINAWLAYSPTPEQAARVAMACKPHPFVGVGVLEFVRGAWKFDIIKSARDF